jgi:hypothetical protein
MAVDYREWDSRPLSILMHRSTYMSKGSPV